jgi:hypothetical protein
MTIRAKGNEEARKEIEKVQKGIDELRKKAIELNKELKEKQALKVDTKEIEQKLKDINKQMSEEKRLAGLLNQEYSSLTAGARKAAEEEKKLAVEAKKLAEAEEKAAQAAKKAADGLEAMSRRAIIDNLRDMSNVLGGVSSAVLNIGKDLVSSAAQAEDFRSAMLTVFKGNQEAADEMLAWGKEFANFTPFDTGEVVQMIIKLKGYGLTVDEVKEKLREMGDMAAAKNKSLSQAVEAFGDARMGDLERLREFDTSRQMIDEAVNGRLSQAKDKAEEMKLIVEGLSKIIESNFAGGMERASKNFEGQVSNLRGEVQGLKEELGAQVIPELSKLVEKGAELVQWLRDLPPEVKNNIATWGEWALGITAAGAAVAGIGTYIIPAIETIGGLSVALIGLPATIYLAIGAIAAIGIEWMKTSALIKQNELKTEMDKTASAVRVLRGAYNEVSGAASLYLKVKKELAESKDEPGFASSEEGKAKLGAAKDIGGGWLSDLKQELSNKEKTYFKDVKNTTLIEMLFGDNLEEQEADLKTLRDRIKELEADIENFQGAEKLAGLTSKGPVNPDYKPADNHGPKIKTITDTELSGEMQLQKNLLKANQQTWEQYVKNLQDFNSKYKLEKDQKAKIDAEIVQTTDQEGKKLIQSQKQTWQGFLSELKVALSSGEISQKEYNQNISNYLHEHTQELKNNSDLRVKIEKEYYAGVNKLQKEQVKEAKEAEKERVKTIKDSWSNFINELVIKLNEGEITQRQYVEAIKKYQQEHIQEIQKVSGLSLDIEKKYSQEVKKIRQEEAREAKKAAEEKKKINKEVEEAIAELTQTETEKKISAINKQVDALEKAGADEVKIQELTQKSIRKLQEETFQDFKQKEDQKKKEIEDTAKTIQSINDKIAANNQKIKDLESGSSFGTGSPLMSAEEALSKSFSDHLDPYIEKLEQTKALERENQALMSERDKAFQKEQEQQSELKKIQEERNAAQDAFNTALQGTVDKYSAVSQASPWEAEKKKIEEATAAAEKYNSVSSGGGEGSGSDADKKGGGGSGEGGGNNENTSSGGNSSSGGSQNYIPAYVPQGQGGNNPRFSTQGQGGNLPSNYTSSGFSTNTSSISNPYAGQFGTGKDPQPLQPSVNPGRSNQGWDWTPNYSTMGDLGSWGFDNPANDAMAFKAMEKMTSDFAIPIITKSMKDMVTNMLGGMVSSVSSIVNSPSYSTTNSQVSNYKSTTSITNYNTSLDNKQIAASSPVERNVRELNSLLQKFKRV